MISLIARRYRGDDLINSPTLGSNFPKEETLFLNLWLLDQGNPVVELSLR